MKITPFENKTHPTCTSMDFSKIMFSSMYVVIKNQYFLVVIESGAGI